MTTSTLPVTDPVRIQAIKESIAEGRNILRTGMYNGKKITVEQRLCVRKSVESDLAKIGQSLFAKPWFKIVDVTPAGYGPTC